MRVTANNKRFTVKHARHRLRHWDSVAIYSDRRGSMTCVSGAYGPQDK